MCGRLLQVVLATAIALPLLGAPQNFVCKNADECTEALRLGVPGSVERLTVLAESGDTDAQLRLGYYYYGRLKTPSQPSGDSWLQGTKWLKMAASQGNPEALFHAGKLLEIDRVRFFHLAAEQGYAPAQLELAFHYSDQGDLVQYRKWFLLAVKDLPESLREEPSRESEMTPAQIAEGDRLAREWKPKTWAELRAADAAN